MGGGGQTGEPGCAMNALPQILERPGVVRLAQVAVGMLLAWAALAKLGDIPALARDIHHFRIIPVASENLLAIVLPWIELTAALSLLLGIRARAGAVVATCLMTVLTLVVVLAMARGLNIECGCFGSTRTSHVGVPKLLMNLGILAAAGVAMVQPRPGAGHDSLPSPRATMSTS